MARIEEWVLAELRDLWSPLLPASTALSDVDAAQIAIRFSALLAGLGWDVATLGIEPAAAALASAAEAIEEAAAGDALTALVAVAVTVAKVGQTLGGVIPDAAAGGELLLDVTSALLAGWLSRRHPAVRAVLIGLGLLTEQPAVAVHAVAADPNSALLRPATVRTGLDLAKLDGWVRSPETSFRDLFLGPDANGAEVVWAIAGPLLADALSGAGVPVRWGLPVAVDTPAGTVEETPPVLWIFSSEDLAAPGREQARFWCGITVQQDAASGHQVRLNVAPHGVLTVSRTRGSWQLTAGVELDVPASIGSDGVQLAAGAGGAATVELASTAAAVPVGRLGIDGGPALVVGGAAVTAGLRLAAGSPPVPAASVTVSGLRLELGKVGLDSFLASRLPDQAGGGGVTLTLRWAGDTGLSFEASGGFEVEVADRIDLGIVVLRRVLLGLDVGDQGLGGRATFDIALAIGPLAAAVEGLGVAVTLAPVAGQAQPGVRVGPRAPTGIGLALHAGGVGGGGYLFFDDERHLYGGAAQLSFKVLTFTAIGLISTRAADGSPGWSMLLIITAEFPPIALGYGFTLNGVGGLLGVHRSVNSGALSDGVRTGALNTVLFPRDPVPRAREVVADLQRFFPAADGRFTVGVMAKFAWGPGALLKIEVGLILELPSPLKLVIMGRISAELPDPNDPVAVLRLDVLGIVDFGRGELSIDATLHDSRVGPFAIDGDMALRASWGAQPGFALAVGGFHPQFPTPAGFPALRRLGISLGTSENPRLRLETYLAVTANTVQTGARLELAVSVSALGHTIGAEGHLGFDALITLQPFTFSLTVDGGVSITLDGRPILSARVVIALTGPTPWHLVGYASVSLFLLGEVRIPIDRTFGSLRDLLPPEIDLIVRLIDALRGPAALSTLPPGEAGPVAIRGPAGAGAGGGTGAGAGADERVLHPMGRVTLSQREVPLGKVLRKFGSAVPTTVGQLTVTDLTLGGQPMATTGMQDFFSPGMYEDLPEDERLRRPGFEQMRAGLVQDHPTGGQSVPATSVPVPDGFDEAVVSGGPLALALAVPPPAAAAPGVPVPPPDGRLGAAAPHAGLRPAVPAPRPGGRPAELDAAWAAVGTAGPVVVGQAGAITAAPRPVAVRPERYVLADRTNLRRLGDRRLPDPATSAAEAYDRLRATPGAQVVATRETVA